MLNKKTLQLLNVAMPIKDRGNTIVEIKLEEGETTFHVFSPCGFHAILSIHSPSQSSGHKFFDYKEFAAMMSKLRARAVLHLSFNDSSLIVSETIEKKDGTSTSSERKLEALSSSPVIPSVSSSMIPTVSHVLPALSTLDTSSGLKSIPQLDSLTFSEVDGVSYCICTTGSCVHGVTLDFSTGPSEKTMESGYRGNFKMWDEADVCVMKEGILLKKEDEEMRFVMMIPWKEQKVNVYSRILSHIHQLENKEGMKMVFFDKQKEEKEFEKRLKELRKSCEDEARENIQVMISEKECEIKAIENNRAFSIPVEMEKGKTMEPVKMSFYDFTKFVSRHYSCQWMQDDSYWMMKDEARWNFGVLPENIKKEEA